MAQIPIQFRNTGKKAVLKKTSLSIQQKKRDIINFNFYSGFIIELDSEIQFLTPEAL